MRIKEKIIFTFLINLAPFYFSYLFLPRLRYFILFVFVLTFFIYKFIDKIKKELIFSSFVIFLIVFSFDLFFYINRIKYPEKIYLPDGTLIYRPNQNIITRYSEIIFSRKNIGLVNYIIDKNGYRNKNFPDSITYLVLGDSYAFGLNVTQDSIWPTLLSNFTKKTIYNLGVSNTNPQQYLQTFKNFLEKYPGKEIKYALFMIYQGNDLTDRTIEDWQKTYKAFQNPIIYYKALFGEKKKSSTIYTLYILYKMFKNNELITVNTYTNKETIITKKELYDIEISEKEFLNAPTLDIIKRTLLEFKRICNYKNITPFVIFAPSKAVIYSKECLGEEKKSKFIEYFKQFCNINKIRYIDLTPFIKKESKKQDLYYKLDNHWNSYGNLFVATILKNYLGNDNERFNPGK